MSLFDIILLAVALAMDCLTVSIVSGVILFSGNNSWRVEGGGWSENSSAADSEADHSLQGNLTPPSTLHPPRKRSFRMALLFGFFQALMPLIGWLGSYHFQAYIETYDHWIAFGLLALIGGRMIGGGWRGKSGELEDGKWNPRRLRTQLLLAVATSIDALAVGISFACTGYTHLGRLALPLLIIGLVSFLFSLIGYQLGARFGRSIAHRLKPELLGGVILIGIGIKILIEHLLIHNS